jgi:DNA excision repair protein ERCC-6
MHGVQDRRNALAGIDILRKICNHPDLLQRRQWESNEKYGDPVRSGKLAVALKVPPSPCPSCWWCALSTTQT